MAANSWEGMAGIDMAPESWGECVNLLLTSGGEETIYRGHTSFDWELHSTLERALLERAEQLDDRKIQVMQSPVADTETETWANDVETSLTTYFRRNAMRFEVPLLPETWDTLGWWEVMQHHGAPTRLMDWTLSPFIAIWFALNGHNDGEGDMALWIYDRRTAAQNHVGAEKRAKEISGDLRLDDRRLLNQYIQFAIEDNNPALIAALPRQFPRAVAQQSVLTVSPSIAIAGSTHRWIRGRLATRIRLRQEWKPEMVTVCQSMGLSRPRLFRDLDTLGQHVWSNFIRGENITSEFL
jgi:hypothetical protein